MKIKLRKKYLNLCEDFSKVSETFISINQIDDAYQEVFRRVAAVEKFYLERFKESRGESKK